MNIGFPFVNAKTFTMRYDDGKIQDIKLGVEAGRCGEDQ